MSLSPFLCTTALAEFWDLHARQIVFLGPWCLRYDRREDWEKLNYQVLPHPWEDREAMFRAARYQETVYEELLDVLVNFLNDVHGERHEKRYWRIIVGPWLLYYVQAMHERYLCLRSAFDRHPGIRTVGLAPSSFKIPRDFADYTLCSGDDPYNLQLYTSLLTAMGLDVPVSDYFWGRPADMFKSPPSLKRLLRGSLERMAYNSGLRWARRAQVLMVDIPFKQMMEIAVLSRFKARLCKLPKAEEWTADVKEEYDERDRLRLSGLAVKKSDPFKTALIKTLSANFPLLYLEGYRSCREWVMQMRGGARVETILTATGLFIGDTLKFLAAELKERGCRLIVIQHGGLYGSALYFPNEIIEREAADKFWSWGWGEEEEGVQPMPSPKLALLRAAREKSKHGGEGYILFVGNNLYRYQLRTWSCPPASLVDKEYLDWQILFLQSLDEEAGKSLIVRPYPIEYGLALRRRLSDACQDLRLDPPDRNYYQSLLGASLVICDINTTTLLEALAADIPTIAFWNPKVFELRKSAKPYYQSLRDAGILYDSPVRAAEKVNRLWPEATQWWSGETVQRARSKFVRNFAWTTKGWKTQWRKAMRSLTLM